MLIQNVLQFLFRKLIKLNLKTDSTVCKSIGTRQGVGRIKHLEIRSLWLQGHVKAKRIYIQKVGTRENPAAYKKHVGPNENAELWFHHGILQADGSHADDPNYPGYQFETLFEKRWGVKPSGDMYNAYKLVKSFRDGMQKALWVNKGNPNRQKLVDALNAMANDESAMANIRKKVGKYDWLIGEAGNNHRDTLMTFVTAEALSTLVKFNRNALGLNSVEKIELALK